ncbi:prepilin peptidase [Microbacterium dextranolyticum]|uniref:Prepilin type IV endopeptidase peptidase domain-containing protein n=1 Tax=Microbacterium dextranolyticum TaxID=36806 RepID=A0A9W6M6V7_9MICO|nr:A24 family peptidase [Microbacterium dextranolyticum]MBM7462610.1 leader peptidase (prepilin peptidase)/N-methyltransferase [Microbacterium dextranolyticum]GLJ96287.1 hypothetical protein GCM10017591_23500 [Microbacterium dextranolyticum]
MGESPSILWIAVAALGGASVGGAAGHAVHAAIRGVGILARRPVAGAATALVCAAASALCTATDAYGTASPVSRPLAFALVLAASLYLAALTVALTVIDVRIHRLPNAIVLPAYPVLALAFAAACLAGAPWGGLVRAALAGAVLFAFFAALRLVRPGAMGGGDVKLAGVVGAALGWIGWTAVVVGTLAAFVAGGLVGAVLIGTRRATGATAIPFGPFLLFGLWAGAALSLMA